MAGVKGMKHRRPRTERERDAYRLGRIEKLLQDAQDGKIELTVSQRFSIEQQYSKLKPSLSAVEKREADARDLGDPEKIMQGLIAKFEQRPELLAQLANNPALQKMLQDRITGPKNDANMPDIEQQPTEHKLH